MEGSAGWLDDAPPEQVAGRHLVLRRWRLDDVDAQVTAVVASGEHLTRWMRWADGFDADRSREFLGRAHRLWAARDSFMYAVVDPAGTIAGSCGLHARLDAGGLEIGYWIGAGHARRGLATRAAAILTAVAFRLEGINRVEIHHDPANQPSGRIPRTLGYTHVATSERPPQAPGDSGAAWHWGLTAAQFPDSVAARLAADEVVSLRRS